MKETVLISGSAGFIGQYVVKDLKNNGYEVIEFDKKLCPNDDLLFSNFEMLEKCDYVVSLASLVGLKFCYENPVNGAQQNLVGTARLLDACSKHKNIKKFVYCSTWAAKGDVLVNPYDISKKAAEDYTLFYAKEKGLPATVVRFGTAFGAGMSNIGVIPHLLKQHNEEGKFSILGRGDQIRQFTHASDIAQGVRLAMEKGESGEMYYLVADEVVSVNELIEIIGGNAAKVAHKEARKGDTPYVPISSDKAKNELGWNPQVKLKDGIKEVAEWLKNQK